MSNTVRSIALIALLTLLTAPALAPLGGAPSRGAAQDPDGSPLRGPDQDPNGGRSARAERAGSGESGISQGVVIARLLSV